MTLPGDLTQELFDLHLSRLDYIHIYMYIYVYIVIPPLKLGPLHVLSQHNTAQGAEGWRVGRCAIGVAGFAGGEPEAWPGGHWWRTRFLLRALLEKGRRGRAGALVTLSVC